MNTNGQLTIVGTGIITPAHLSQAAISQIKQADVVHVLVPDPLGLSTINKLNSNIKNLAELYYDPQSSSGANNRLEAYDLMVESLLKDVRQGLKVCAVFYGHPGVFVYPSHTSIAQAKSEGFYAEMLPAISAEDCLFSDLAIDPGDLGCQSYEASQFLFYKTSINTKAPLILWQIGVVGDVSLTQLQPTQDGLAMLQQKLSQLYGNDHLITLYEASTLPIMPARVEIFPLAELSLAKVKTITTLFVPAIEKADIDFEFCNQWQIDTAQL
jgi:uroporphyrin-III C-methyltransferase